MQVPGWLVFLGIELIIVLLITIVVLIILWKRTCNKHKQRASKLIDELHQQKNAYKSLKDETLNLKSESDSSELAACREQVEILQLQLEQARENPFLQEKIDALTAENEDLQSQLQAYRG